MVKCIFALLSSLLVVGCGGPTSMCHIPQQGETIPSRRVLREGQVPPNINIQYDSERDRGTIVTDPLFVDPGVALVFALGFPGNRLRETPELIDVAVIVTAETATRLGNTFDGTVHNAAGNTLDVAFQYIPQLSHDGIALYLGRVNVSRLRTVVDTEDAAVTIGVAGAEFDLDTETLGTITNFLTFITIPSSTR